MYKLSFYVPETALESVKEALFKVGAGRIGNYEHCCWEVLGKGQFQALPGSDPFIGKIDQLETVSEYRVEMVCEEAVIDAVVEELKAVHPYETPAFDVVKTVAF